MNRTLRTVLTTVLGAAAAAACVVFLTGEGLDRAEKWISVTGVFASVTLAAVGLWGWPAWRQAPDHSVPAQEPAAPTGPAAAPAVAPAAAPTVAPAGSPAGVTASGPGSVAIGGNNSASIRTRVSGADGGTTQ
ncbi:hypothetical protein [Actinoplanes sp. NPDC051859]|uniref:hypothetical protein n=1 Tax=Actinoplanes sp. NPDC051859 TaxID=3363909 RepID=UPI00379CE38B